MSASTWLPPLSPDCRAGKCGACVGTAWDNVDDELTQCQHPCHPEVDPDDEEDERR